MHRSLFTFALIILSGCGSRITYLPTNTAPRALEARPAEQVEIFTASRPERGYVEVGIIESQQESMYSSSAPEAVFQALREEAGKRGCDGLIVLGSNDAVGAVMLQQGAFPYTLRGYRGTCVVWKEAPEELPAASAATAPAE